jgi:hypothetical protein
MFKPRRRHGVRAEYTNLGKTSAVALRSETQRQFEAVGRVDYAIVVVGRFEYEDIYGNLYQTDFCNGTRPSAI